MFCSERCRDNLAPVRGVCTVCTQDAAAPPFAHPSILLTGTAAPPGSLPPSTMQVLIMERHVHDKVAAIAQRSSSAEELLRVVTRCMCR